MKTKFEIVAYRNGECKRSYQSDNWDEIKAIQSQWLNEGLDVYLHVA